MALSNSQYDAIMREYGKRQMENPAQPGSQKKEVYEKVPAVKELEAENCGNAPLPVPESCWRAVRMLFMNFVKSWQI